MSEIAFNEVQGMNGTRERAFGMAPIAVFVLLTFAISAAVLFGGVAFFPAAQRPDNFPGILFWLVAVWSPNIAAALVAGRTEPGGARRLFAGFFTTRGAKAASWLLGLTPLAVAGLSLGGLALVSPALEWGAGPGVGMLFAMLVLHLPLGPTGEEAGWRGFLHERLRLRFSALVSALFTALVWGLWHLPLWLLPASPQAAIPVHLFLMHVLCYALVMALIRETSGASLLPCVLFHLSANFVLGLIGVLLPKLAPGTVFLYTLPAYALAGGAALFGLMRAR